MKRLLVMLATLSLLVSGCCPWWWDHDHGGRGGRGYGGHYSEGYYGHDRYR